MVYFSMSYILFLNAINSIPLFLMYMISKSLNYSLLISTFILSHSVDLYFQRFITKSIHLVVLLIILITMTSYMYEKYRYITFSEIVVIFTTMMIGLYFLLKIIKRGNNYVLNNGYIIFTGISFLYFSSLPGIVDSI
jgi:hypothetical protein